MNDLLTELEELSTKSSAKIGNIKNRNSYRMLLHAQALQINQHFWTNSHNSKRPLKNLRLKNRDTKPELKK